MASTADTPHSPAATPRPDGNRDMPATDPDGAQPGDDMFGRVVQGAHETIDRLAESAAPHVHKLQDSVAAASDQLHHRADRALEVGDEWTESLRCMVRDHPLAAVATAVAVGMLLARATHR